MASVVAPEPADRAGSLSGVRLIAGYVAVVGFLAAAVIVSISGGHGRHAAPGVAGFWSSQNACLGKSFKLDQSGSFVDLSGGPSGKLRIRHDRLSGTAGCLGGGTAAVS